MKFDELYESIIGNYNGLLKGELKRKIKRTEYKNFSDLFKLMGISEKEFASKYSDPEDLLDGLAKYSTQYGYYLQDNGATRVQQFDPTQFDEFGYELFRKFGKHK